MKIRMPILIAVLLAGAPPLFAQEHAAPPERPQPLLLDRVPWREHGEPIERLERLRFKRLHEALGLSEEQAATLHEHMERSHEEMRRSFERQKEAVEALERTLAVTPIDEEALRRSLAEVEGARAQMEAQRERHMAELERTLSLEQRAKFLIFNRHFDSRLRELVEKHRGRHGAAAPHEPMAQRGIGAPFGRQATREQKIEMLERRIAEMEREIEELRAGD